MGEQTTKPRAKKLSDRILLAIELEKLHKLVMRKCKRLKLFCPWGDRGTACTSVVGGAEGRLLTVYEGGYRTTLYPRMTWNLGHGGVEIGHLAAVRDAVRLECAEKDRVVGLADHRPAASPIMGDLPSLAYCEPLGTDWNTTPPRKAMAAGRLNRAAYMFATGDAGAEAVRAEGWALAPEWRPR